MDSETLVYGPIVGVHNIDDAIITHLKKWQRSYLNEVARQNNESLDRFQKMRNFRASHEVEFMPEDQRPCCVVVCAGPEGEPSITGSIDGIGQRVQMTWQYQIGIQVVANGQKIRSMPRAHQLAMMYISAVRVALENQPSDILAMRVEWRGEEPGAVDSEDERRPSPSAPFSSRFRPSTFVASDRPNQKPTMIRCPTLRTTRWSIRIT
jgi:hypothetical protein